MENLIIHLVKTEMRGIFTGYIENKALSHEEAILYSNYNTSVYYFHGIRTNWPDLHFYPGFSR